MEESIFEDEADPGMFSDAPSSVPLPDDPEIPSEADSPTSPVGALPSDSHSLEARITEAARSPASDI